MDKYTLYYTTEMQRFSEMIKNSTGMSKVQKIELFNKMISELKRGKEKTINTASFA